MNKKILLSLMLVVGFVLVSCNKDNETKTTVVNFEDVTLGNAGYWNGSDGSGYFTSNAIRFNNTYNASWGTWSGFACSSLTDSATVGWNNQYSVSAGIGASSSAKFGLVYGDGNFVCPANINGNYAIKSLMVTNSTYAYKDMLNGSDYSKKFSTAGNDWFKVTVTGYLSKAKTGSVDYYLADFRNGKSFLSKSWVKLDVSALGKVDSVTFSFASCDTGEFGINTPTYACVDDIVLEQQNMDK
mgnify:CR=1 FL=1